MVLLPPPIYFFVYIYIDYNEQEASFKEKGQEKKKTAIEELVDGSIQLPEVNYFISQADRRGGGKYSLIKQMMKAIKQDNDTDTGLNSAGILVRDLCTGVPLHFLPGISSAVTRPRDADRFDDFTFVDTGGRQCAHKIGTRITRVTEMFNRNEPVIGRYKGNEVRLHKIDNLPVDDMILSMKAHDDIMPFNNPPRH